MSNISAIVIARDEEHQIEACLKSIRWTDEIILVDTGSTDSTVARSRPLATKVIESEWLGYAGTKTLALEHTTGSWVLWVDADEIVPDALGIEIQSTIAGNNDIAGYYVPRRAIFLGKWIKHCGWYPGYVCRLFKRENGRFDDSLVHESVQVEGQMGYLKNALIHNTDRTLSHYINKLNNYTTLAAQQIHDKGRSFKLLDLLFRPLFTFIKMYILKLGFLDGVHGLILSLLSGYYVFTKYAKLWLIQRPR